MPAVRARFAVESQAGEAGVGRKADVEKARYGQRTIREAARSGLPIREFRRQRKLHESQFYGWQRRLRIGGGVDEETLRAVLAAVERQGC